MFWGGVRQCGLVHTGVGWGSGVGQSVTCRGGLGWSMYGGLKILSIYPKSPFCLSSKGEAIAVDILWINNEQLCKSMQYPHSLDPPRGRQSMWIRPGSTINNFVNPHEIHILLILIGGRQSMGIHPGSTILSIHVISTLS